uniref:Zinc finger GRF-type domain-containing protein n=1 Tax=Oryza nivara TaxID=4536 RepID=A0A0E0HXQ4_ORYNI
MASSMCRFSPRWQSVRVCFAHRFPTLTTSPTLTLKPNGRCVGIGDALRFFAVANSHCSHYLASFAPRTADNLELRTSRTPANPNKRFVKCPRLEHVKWACKFFMWETQYEQLLKDMQAGNRQAGRLVLNHDGGKPWM